MAAMTKNKQTNKITHIKVTVCIVSKMLWQLFISPVLVSLLFMICNYGFPLMNELNMWWIVIQRLVVIILLLKPSEDSKFLHTPFFLL